MAEEKKQPLWRKIVTVENVFAAGQWVYANWALIAAFVVGGGGMTYLAAITDWVKSAGPVAIGAIGIVSTLIIWLGISGAQNWRARAQERRATARAIEKWKAEVTLVNPMESEFRKMRIKISDLAHPVTNRIKGKTFHNCELLGPAVIVFAHTGKQLLIGTRFSNCDNILMKDGAAIANTYIFEDVEIINCSFWQCTIYVSRAMLPQFKEMGAYFINEVGDKELDAAKRMGGQPSERPAPNRPSG